MLTPNLYRVPKERLGELADLFADAFQNDPLYQKLIPDEKKRNRILPKFFKLYLDVYNGHCHIYADSEQLQGAVVAFDQQDFERLPSFRHLCSLAGFFFQMVWLLLDVDPSGKTALAFAKNRQFLTSKWADSVGANHIHIDFLAVSPKSQGKGIASKLVKPLLHYADQSTCRTTLETHNPKNLGFYRHLGFQVVEELDSREGALRQFCLER